MSTKKEGFPERLKILRKAAGLKQRELAEKAGVTVQSVKAWEAGKNLPRSDCMALICDFFNCDMEYLTGEQYTPRKEIQELAEQSGIDYSAVMSMSSLDPDARRVLNLLLEAKDEKYGNVLNGFLSELWLAVFGGLNYFWPDLTTSEKSIDDRVMSGVLRRCELLFLQEGYYDKAYKIVIDAVNKERQEFLEN